MYEENREDLLRRLRKIEGQVKGIQKMIESDAYCIDVLIQVAAVRSAINSVAKILLKSYATSCIKGAVCAEKQEDMVDDLVETFIKFMR
ncbi:MAG: metal-sensitive transcriptional regulator [Caldanaerobacter sp.]|jgi:DNA-binding FrmR family transcriptional regulator|uniref:metal-sensitive transcriptional regulator n=1 Tax=Caldanaerobacter sp. TaxID=2930036 RepID=UPI003C78904E